MWRGVVLVALGLTIASGVGPEGGRLRADAGVLARALSAAAGDMGADRNLRLGWSEAGALPRDAVQALVTSAGSMTRMVSNGGRRFAPASSPMKNADGGGGLKTVLVRPAGSASVPHSGALAVQARPAAIEPDPDNMASDPIVGVSPAVRRIEMGAGEPPGLTLAANHVHDLFHDSCSPYPRRDRCGSKLASGRVRSG